MRMTSAGLWLLTAVLLAGHWSSPATASYSFIRCGECDESRCPELHYCEGQAIKDHCDCCTVCSSSKFQPHVMISRLEAGNACDQVKCPKLKVCVVNMQGLPLCTCPSMYVCRGVPQREVCGTDGNTYQSRCHMRIAACDEGITVRKKHRGACGDTVDEENSSSGRRRVKKNKKRRRRGRKEDNEVDAEDKRERRRRREKRRRRKINRKRARRHRGKKKQDSSKSFDEIFPDHTWQA